MTRIFFGEDEDEIKLLNSVLICQLKVLMLTLQNDPPTLETISDSKNDDYRRYSRPFRRMISLCLQKEPRQRYSTDHGKVTNAVSCPAGRESCAMRREPLHGNKDKCVLHSLLVHTSVWCFSEIYL